MKCSYRLILSSALLLVTTATARAQAGDAAAPQPLPKNADALMRLAAEENGLEGAGIQPWYIHATWQLAAGKESPAMQGTFEEWWSSPEHSKVTYSGPGFHPVLDITPAGASMDGEAQWPDPVLRLIDPLLRSPLPSPSRLSSLKFANNNAKDKDLRLRCAAIATGSEERPSLYNTDLWFASNYCFSGNVPAIRVETDAQFDVIFNSIVRFQGRYLAESIHVARSGLPALDIRVDEVRTTHDATASPEGVQP